MPLVRRDGLHGPDKCHDRRRSTCAGPDGQKTPEQNKKMMTILSLVFAAIAIATDVSATTAHLHATMLRTGDIRPEMSSPGSTPIAERFLAHVSSWDHQQYLVHVSLPVTSDARDALVAHLALQVCHFCHLDDCNLAQKFSPTLFSCCSRFRA